MRHRRAVAVALAASFDIVVNDAQREAETAPPVGTFPSVFESGTPPALA